MHSSRYVAYGLSLVGLTVGFWLWMNGNGLGRPLMILCWLCSPSGAREETEGGGKAVVVLLMAVIGIGLVLGWGFLVAGMELSPELNRAGHAGLYGLFVLWVVGQFLREWRRLRMPGRSEERTG